MLTIFSSFFLKIKVVILKMFITNIAYTDELCILYG